MVLHNAEIDAAGRLPFWFTDRLSSSAVLYAMALTLIAAIVSGVVPALKVTGRSVGARLRQSASGAGGLRFGGVWTAVIVAQVAVTVAFPATVFFVRSAVVDGQTLDVGFRAAEFLSARLEMDREFQAAVSDAGVKPNSLRMCDRCMKNSSGVWAMKPVLPA